MISKFLLDEHIPEKKIRLQWIKKRFKSFVTTARACRCAPYGTFLVIVAEKRKVCRSRGMALTILSTSTPKSMLRIRSASSITWGERDGGVRGVGESESNCQNTALGNVNGR